MIFLNEEIENKEYNSSSLGVQLRSFGYQSTKKGSTGMVNVECTVNPSKY